MGNSGREDSDFSGMSWVRNALANISLICVSVAVVLLVCELIVFRFVLLPSDVPRNSFIDGLVRYAPNQRGVYRVQDEIAAPFAINTQGWNSGVGDYRIDRLDGRSRIAVVGDSYVEAFQVPYDRSLAERMAENLDRVGEAAEVYRFAVSGASLSHYLYMLEREVVAYSPDEVVLVLVHNDFDESFRFVAGRYTSSFMKLALESGRVTHEIPPTPYAETWRDWLRQLATVRYLYYRKQVRLEALRGMILGEARAETVGFEANIDVANVLSRLPEVTAATDYLFGRLAALARLRGFRLLLVMDANRAAVYAGTEARAEGASALNILAAEVAARRGIPFLDLTKAFANDWRMHGERLEFQSDAHWNPRGHEIAARAIIHALRPGLE